MRSGSLSIRERVVSSYSLSLRERVGVRGDSESKRARGRRRPHPNPLPEGEGTAAESLLTPHRVEPPPLVVERRALVEELEPLRRTRGEVLILCELLHERL